MPINIGYVESTIADGDVVVRIYYDATFTPVGDSQPLINGPRGFCLDVTNKSGRNVSARVSGVGKTPLTFVLGQGDPVTTGQSRSRTAAQVAALGFLTRGDVGDFGLS